MDDQDGHVVEFTDEELQGIMQTLERMEHECFNKWVELCPEREGKPNKECRKQWKMLLRITDIKYKTAKALGLKAGIEWEHI